MKGRQKLIYMLLILVLAFLAAVPSDVTKAEDKAEELDTKIRIDGEGFYNDNVIRIPLQFGDTVENIKADSKKIAVKLTHYDMFNSGDDSYENSADIGAYVKANGTYTVSFDIVKSNGEKRSSEKVTIYAYPYDYTVTVDGKYDWVVEKDTGKVKIKLGKGNKIVKLEYGGFQLNDEGNTDYDKVKYRKFKNGDKIIFSSQPSVYNFKYEYENEEGKAVKIENNNTDIMASTFIRITYKDKYTKENEIIEEQLVKLVNK